MRENLTMGQKKKIIRLKDNEKICIINDNEVIEIYNNKDSFDIERKKQLKESENIIIKTLCEDELNNFVFGRKYYSDIIGNQCAQESVKQSADNIYNVVTDGVFGENLNHEEIKEVKYQCIIYLEK